MQLQLSHGEGHVGHDKAVAKTSRAHTALIEGAERNHFWLLFLCDEPTAFPLAKARDRSQHAVGLLRLAVRVEPEGELGITLVC